LLTGGVEPGSMETEVATGDLAVSSKPTHNHNVQRGELKACSEDWRLCAWRLSFTIFSGCCYHCCYHCCFCTPTFTFHSRLFTNHLLLSSLGNSIVTGYHDGAVWVPLSVSFQGKHESVGLQGSPHHYWGWPCVAGELSGVGGCKAYLWISLVLLCW